MSKRTSKRLEEGLNHHFANREDLTGEPGITILFQSDVPGHEGGKLRLRSQITVVISRSFLLANPKEAGLATAIHTEAASQLTSMGKNPKTYNPVLASRVA
jgi:hypothetical protein